MHNDGDGMSACAPCGARLAGALAADTSGQPQPSRQRLTCGARPCPWTGLRFAALPHGRSSHFMRVRRSLPAPRPSWSCLGLIFIQPRQDRCTPWNIAASSIPPFPACWLHHAGRAAEAVYLRRYNLMQQGPGGGSSHGNCRARISLMPLIAARFLSAAMSSLFMPAQRNTL